MTLYGQSGTLIDAGGGIASSAECCCNVGDGDGDGGPTYPPPSGPDCGCGVYFFCTVQVTYDGLTVALLHGTGSSIYYKTAGIHTYWLGGNNYISNSIDRVLEVLPRGFCTNTPATVFGNCGLPNQSLLYHLLISYGVNLQAKNRFTAYFRYNIDAAENQPCPGEVGGRQVTISEVARVPGLGFSVNPADCGLSCQENLQRIKASSQLASPFGFAQYVVRRVGLLWSYRWSMLRWANYQGQQDPLVLPDPIRGDQQDAPDDEFWPCDVPIWDVQHPTVTIACPP